MDANKNDAIRKNFIVAIFLPKINWLMHKNQVRNVIKWDKAFYKDHANYKTKMNEIEFKDTYD